MQRPEIVTVEEWQKARDALLVKEKSYTRALDRLAAERRRMPMVRMATDYAFTAPDGSAATFTDLFDGSRQLVVYHYMMEPGQDWLCGGCASFVDNIPHLDHLKARDTSLVVMARAPQDQIEVMRKRMGWTVPWYSSAGTTFNDDLGLQGFGLSVFLCDGDEVFRTYFTTSRGVDRLRMDFSLLDLTPYGRQEAWEVSPEGWPQDPAYKWWRIRDEYQHQHPAQHPSQH